MATEDGPPSLDLLVEENVQQQVRNLLACQVVADDWKRRGEYGVTVHGWVYQLENVSLLILARPASIDGRPNPATRGSGCVRRRAR
jgi:carbonic anhydrase